MWPRKRKKIKSMKSNDPDGICVIRIFGNLLQFFDSTLGCFRSSISIKRLILILLNFILLIWITVQIKLIGRL